MIKFPHQLENLCGSLLALVCVLLRRYFCLPAQSREQHLHFFLDQMKNSVLCFIFFFQLGGAFVDAENNNCKKLKATDIESVMERDLQ